MELSVEGLKVWQGDGIWKILGVIVALVIWLAVVEQAWLYWEGGRRYPGPTFVLPFMNSILEMVRDPESFWDRQHNYDHDGISWNAIVGRLTLFVTKPEYSRKVMSNQGPNSFFMEIHPNAKWIFSEGNIALMWGHPHKVLRRSFLNLFTRKALSLYLIRQEAIIRKHIAKWLEESACKEVDIRHYIRPLTLDVSQSVFVGDYVEDREKFGNDYQAINDGLLCLPLYFPGTTLWKACRARERVEDQLETFATRSKKLMEAGESATCLLDFWSERIVEESLEAVAKGEEKPEYERSRRMAETLIDFLFAAQDASTASLVWVVKLVGDRPDVLAKVREEQERLRPNNGPITFEAVTNMTYTRAVIMEVLRFKPPALTIPQRAMANVKLDENVSIPKGTLVMPSLWEARNHGWKSPEIFDPERMMPGRDELLKNRANFLTFGIGPHACVGKEYAINTLIAFLSILSTSVNWTRRNTENSDRITYLPTTYPYDCLVTMKARK